MYYSIILPIFPSSDWGSQTLNHEAKTLTTKPPPGSNFQWFFFKKMGHPCPPFRLFSSFQTNITIYSVNKCDNIHPVYGAEIRTHNPLKHESPSRPILSEFSLWYRHLFLYFCCIFMLKWHWLLVCHSPNYFSAFSKSIVVSWWRKLSKQLEIKNGIHSFQIDLYNISQPDRPGTVL